MKTNLKKIFKNKKILITGHTGFKGSWLTLWLSNLGAKIYGISLKEPTKPSNYKVLKLDKKCNTSNININQLNLLKNKILRIKPDYIFHLAAQSIVKKSYEDPINTFQSNSIGTLNLLESLRNLKKKCIVVLVTSDKSYKNLELKRGYRENDILGGYDPYSASKASAEIIIQSYIHSYFKKKEKITIGIARAGNVIGGGDWSHNRLIPDCIKSWSKNKKVNIRSPLSTRPWQHVLEAIGAYLILAANLKKNNKLHGEIFNFGPGIKTSRNVIQLVKKMSNYWNKVLWRVRKKKKFHEANLLKLNCKKAHRILKWKSLLSFNETIKMTTEWYREFYMKKKNMLKISIQQINNYEKKIFKFL